MSDTNQKNNAEAIEKHQQLPENEGVTDAEDAESTVDESDNDPTFKENDASAYVIYN